MRRIRRRSTEAYDICAATGRSVSYYTGVYSTCQCPYRHCDNNAEYLGSIHCMFCRCHWLHVGVIFDQAAAKHDLFEKL